MSQPVVTVRRIDSRRPDRMQRHERLTDIRELEPGDELAVYRAYMFRVFYHHRIVIDVNVLKGTYSAVEFTISDLSPAIGSFSEYGGASDCDDYDCKRERNSFGNTANRATQNAKNENENENESDNENENEEKERSECEIASANRNGTRANHDHFDKLRKSCTVLNYNGYRSHHGGIYKVCKSFSGSRRIYRINYDPRYLLPPIETVRRAIALIGTQPVYHWLFNNCVHFTSWCKIGQAFSLQTVGYEQVLSDCCTERDKDNAKDLLTWAIERISQSAAHDSDGERSALVP